MGVDLPYRPGQLILGKYRVTSVLGAGGMGFVLAAEHLRMGGQVALKMLLPELALNPTFVERFAREAYSASKIRSEHVARVLDVETLDDGLPLIVMEMLEGHDLAREVQLNGPLELAQAAEFVLQACEALAEAHSLGIIHRDLKPANLFLTKRADRSALIKVMDFGIAKALEDADGPSLTATQDIVGSPLYMSPEQLRSSRNVDARTDVWSLGVILYELVSGDVPFSGASSAAVLAAVAADRPRPIQELLPDVPPAFIQLLEKALEKSPEHRHENIAEFARELGAFAPDSARLSTERISRIIYGQAGPPKRPADQARGQEVSTDTILAPGTNSRSTPPASVKTLEQRQEVSRRSNRQTFRTLALVTAGLLVPLMLWVKLVPEAPPKSEAEVSMHDEPTTNELAAKEQDTSALDSTRAAAQVSTTSQQAQGSALAEPTKIEEPQIPPPRAIHPPASSATTNQTRPDLTKTAIPHLQTFPAPGTIPMANEPGTPSRSLIDQATETRK